MSLTFEEIQGHLWEDYDKYLRQVEAKIPHDLRKHFDAEDILQEAYSVAWNRASDSEFQNEHALTAWFRVVADNKLRDRIRIEVAEKRGNTKRISNGNSSRGKRLKNAIGRFRTPSSQLAAKELSVILTDSLSKLSNRQRTAIQLYYFDGLELATIAAEMRIKKDAARMVIRRAVQKLHANLGRSSFG